MAQEEIAKVAPHQDEVLALLRTKGLSIKNLDEDKKAQVREFLEYLHHSKGVSLSDIAKMIGNKTSGYTSWLCKQVGVEARPFEEARLKGIREKRRKYERKPFDGTDEDKAYLLGLRHGDLSVSKPWKGVVRVSTSTTHRAMADLFSQLFDSYGHIYKYDRFKKDTGTYEWNLSAIIDDSFDFLAWDKSSTLRWVSSIDGLLLNFVAGFLDAEGHIGISRAGRYAGLIISFYNTNRPLLLKIKSGLERPGLHVLGPYLDKPKGTKTSKFGIERKKDYWRIAIARAADCQELLRLLPLKHREKVERKKLACTLSPRTSWAEVAPRTLALRTSIRMERDQFVEEARRAVELRNRTNAC